MGIDSERTIADPGGPVTLRETGLSRVGRGSILGGKYRLEMLLGEGGMGFVWSAYNRELELPVAIKLLRAGKNSQRLADRLRLEARAAARLVHPSIVRVFDVALSESGDPFIVMELLTGQTLAEALRRGPLRGERAVQLLLPIADALGLAHDKGIIHRDFKPENVFLATDGDSLQPKLLDFGIAKLEDRRGAVAKLTEDGIVLGSPHYMSPEQVSGEDVDHRSDVWSFSVVLYKVLTGMMPFPGNDKRAVMDAILREVAPPFLPSLQVDLELERIVRWGMSRDRADRPTSMRELGRALARWLALQGVEEDACGTPLASKWLHPTARPTLRPPPPSPLESAEHDTDPRMRSFTSQPPRVERPTDPIGPRLPRRSRHRELLVALALLMMGGSLAWASTRDSAEPSPATRVQPRPERAEPRPTLAAALPAPVVNEPVVITEPKPAPPQAIVEEPAAAPPKPARARPARRVPQLPF